MTTEHRRILVIAAVLAAFCVLAVAIAVALIDVNRYKPEIEQAVKKHTGRTLQLKGDLGLSVFPALAITLPASTLSARDSDAEFLSFASARVAIALLPLLRQTIIVDSIEVEKARATVTRQRDGSTTVDDMSDDNAVGPAEQRTEETKQAPDDAVAANWEIGRLLLTDGSITLHDEASGKTIALSALNLETGRLAPQMNLPIALTAHVTSTAPELAGDLEVKASVGLDLAASAASLADLKLSFTGMREKQALRASIGAAKVSIDQQTLSGTAIEASLSLFGTQTLEARMALDGVSGSWASLKADQVLLTATRRDGPAAMLARLSGPISASIESQTLAMPKLDGEITIDDPRLPEGGARLPLAGTMAVDVRQEHFEAKLTSTAADAKLQATIEVRDFGQPEIAFDLAADRLNLDRFIAPARQATTGVPAEAGDVPGRAGVDKGATIGAALVAAPPETNMVSSVRAATRAAPTDADAATAAPADPAFDLSPLRDLRLNGTLQIEQLQVRGVKASALRASVRSASGRAVISPANARLYDGKGSGDLTLDAQGNRVSLKLTLNDVEVGGLARDALGRKDLGGRGDLDLVLSSAGQSRAEMTRTAQGTGRFALRDFALVGIDLSAVLGQAQSAMTGGETPGGKVDRSKRTVLSRLTGTVKLADGVARNDDLKGAAPQLGLRGSGQFDLPSKHLDYTLHVTVTANPVQSSKLLTALAGVAIPVHFSGPTDDLRYSIKLTDVVADAVTRRAVGAAVAEEAERFLGRMFGGGKKK